MPTSDKFRDECGVVAIYAHPEAEKLAYLGLHALQHRGQESAGIVTSNGMTLHTHGHGFGRRHFYRGRAPKLHGTLAIGHTRYSTAGDSSLLNAQPIMVQSNKGMMALAHNGNLVNAQEIRHAWKSGLDFSDQQRYRSHRSSDRAFQRADPARSHGRRSAPRGRRIFAGHDQLRSVFAARDPRGFRPLAMGRIPLRGEKQDTVVFASETCAFDLIGATYEREVKPGELIVVAGGHYLAVLLSAVAAIELHLRACLFFAARQHGLRPPGAGEPRRTGTTAGARAPADADIVVPVPDSGVTAAMGYAAESGIPFRFGLDPQPLCRTHLHRAAPDVRDFGVKLKLNPVRSCSKASAWF